MSHAPLPHPKLRAASRTSDSPVAWLLRPLALALALACTPAAAESAPAVPPAGFEPLFNGRDLAGWYGWNPHASAKLAGEALEANLAAQRADFASHWTVDNGELVNDGHGPYATTESEFGDLELQLEYRTVAGADSGIYLRGVPQVQIWDSGQRWDPKNPTRRPHLGSGGLFNNAPAATGRDPAVLADRPFGEWNRCRIRQIGAITWVWLNDRLVVDGAAMENFWDRGQPFPARGPILLQTHGGEIRWRNIFQRPIGPDEAARSLAALHAERRARLAAGLTLHASFDEGFDADFAVGDRACRQGGVDAKPAVPTADVRLVPGAGRFGGALEFVRKNPLRPAYRDAGSLGYDPRGWSRSVSVWLRLDPDRDLEPGYCDPVQILGDDTKQGFIFLEWSKDHSPRRFRYCIRPLFEIWNPRGVGWEEIPDADRPMVQVERAPFSRDAWTHAVFTLENVNDASRPQVGRLYLDGLLQGAVHSWDLSFGWDPARVQLVLGAAYVGQLDDLAVFDHALSDGEVAVLHGLERGVGELR